MSSILKVDTIQDQNGNLIISKDSGGSGFLSPYASSSAAITYTVTVASKTSAHPYNGVGSSNGYFINGIESPIIEIKGNDTSKPYHYKFDQSDSSNSGHPLLFYNNVGKTTGFTTGVTTNGTPGQAGAYTMIAVDSQTPNILYYQCSSHANMGNHTFATSPVVNTGVFLTLPTADGSSGQVVTTNGSGVLSFANGSVPDDAITLAKMAPGTDGNLITYDTSGNPAAVATGSAAQVLTSAGAGAVPSFQTATVPDNAITLAKMAAGTDGNLITYDTSGNPAAVATGSAGQFLKSAGAGAVPSFAALPASGRILQVVSKTDTTNRATTSNSYTSGIGGYLQIQPSSTSSKILIIASVALYIPSATGFLTLTYQGNSLASNSSNGSNFVIMDGYAKFEATSSLTFLHSPSTTDVKSYDVMMRNSNNSTQVECINGYAQANLTLMEIAG
jgi:hypothetical protein